jgi:hypothetical protein
VSERQRCEPGSPLEGKRLADGGTGYRTIPTIGWLFLLQVITGFALAAAVVVMRSQLAAAAGAGFALATLGGYPLSIRTGLFGFKEVATGLQRAGRTLAIRPARGISRGTKAPAGQDG